MGRKATNNPRQIRSKSCGCKLCLAEYPGDRPKQKECSGSWQARYTDPGGKDRAKNWPTEAEAIAFLERTRTQMRDRTWLDPARSEITLTAWHGLWWPKQTGEESTLDRDGRMWRNHVRPRFGSWALYQMGYLEIQGWVNDLHDANGGPLAAASVIKAFQVLDRMLETAKLDRRLPFNPAEGVKLPTLRKKHPEDRRPPTYGQLWRIRALVPEYHHALVILAQETGLRFGELVGLRACNVDLKRRRIHVREVLTEVRGKVRRKVYPKSDAGLRTVPLTELAWRVLRDHMAEEKPSATRSELKDGLCEEELVFHGRNHRNRQGEARRAPLRRSGWRRIWIKAITSTDFHRVTVKTWTAEEQDPETGRMRKVEKNRKDYWPDFHDIRHAFASRMHDRGVPEAVAQEILGHERAGEVTWLYTHAAADYAGQVLAALEDGKPGTRRLRLVAA